jgi:hypothetical protein
MDTIVSATANGTAIVIVSAFVTVTDLATVETATGNGHATWIVTGATETETMIATTTAVLLAAMTRTTTTAKGGLARRTGRESTAGEWIETLTSSPMVTSGLAHPIAGADLMMTTWTAESREIQRYVPLHPPPLHVTIIANSPSRE